MADLDARIRALAVSGELTHISVIATAGKGPHGIVFAACFAPATRYGQGLATDADPVKAILAAIDDAHKRPRVPVPETATEAPPRGRKRQEAAAAPKRRKPRKNRDRQGEKLLGLD